MLTDGLTVQRLFLYSATEPQLQEKRDRPNASSNSRLFPSHVLQQFYNTCINYFIKLSRIIFLHFALHVEIEERYLIQKRTKVSIKEKKLLLFGK